MLSPQLVSLHLGPEGNTQVSPAGFGSEEQGLTKFQATDKRWESEIWQGLLSFCLEKGQVWINSPYHLNWLVYTWGLKATRRFTQQVLGVKKRIKEISCYRQRMGIRNLAGTIIILP